MRRLRDELTASDKVLPLPSREDSCLGNIERLLKSGVRSRPPCGMYPFRLFFICGLWLLAPLSPNP